MKVETAKQFYEEVKEQADSYKLVNGIFIVKYEDNKLICRYIGDFLKGRTALNQGKTNKVVIKPTKQLFYKDKNIHTTGFGTWKPLEIKFVEKPIKEILK